MSVFQHDDQLKSAIDQLGSRLKLTGLIERCGDFSPAAHWIKEYQGPEKPFVMRWINQQYTTLWGKTQEQYIDRTDEQAGWPEIVWKAFMEMDHRVFQNEVYEWSIEPTDIGPCLTGKFAIKDGNTGYVAGIGIPVNDIMDAVSQIGDSS